jgi:small GTP-binding protein
MEKPGIIKKLEKKTNKELKQLDIENIVGLTNGYAVDGSGNIVGLNLYDANISDISFLKDFHHLTVLYLSSNKIADISPLIGLKNLNRLVLKNNKITRLPDELVELGMKIKWKDDYEDDIILEDNPLETPPIEIVKQGTEAVRNYFIELQEESVHLLHAKLLIVGNGEVGKTTLMKKLKDNKFKVKIGKEPSTHGINIVPWELTCPFKQNNAENVKINFWDFGGQDIYHATHQFFLTKRSLYLLVWEARKEEESRSFDYWLNIIKLLSANSPVIIVMNKSDLRSKHIDEASFKEKFKNIVTFLQVSCVTAKASRNSLIKSALFWAIWTTCKTNFLKSG